MSTSRVTDSVTIIDAPRLGRRGLLGTYLVRGEESVVIDPGPASQTGGVLEALRALGASPVNVVCLTHIHLDHAAGSWMILDQNPAAFVHGHPRGVQHVVDAGKIKAAAEEVFKEGIKDYGEIRALTQPGLRRPQTEKPWTWAAWSSRSFGRRATAPTAKATTSPTAGFSS